MIVVDTNVLSEPLRLSPDPRVLTWLTRHADEIALTTITVGELLYSALRLDEGRRRDALLTAINTLVADAGARVLTYDDAAARPVRAASQGAGRSGPHGQC